MELKGKKVIAVGERDGVQGSAIAKCAESAGRRLIGLPTHLRIGSSARHRLVSLLTRKAKT